MINLELKQIQDKIFTVRNIHVMLDSDLANLFNVETKVLNQAVKRNLLRFPSDFMFQLSTEEWSNIRSQFVTLEEGRGKYRKFLPFVFSEQGVSMLSAVLKSSVAIEISITIIRAFVEMRTFLTKNALIFQRLENIESKQQIFQIQTSEKFEQIFKALDDKRTTPRQGIMYDGQIFDAYKLLSDIVRTAEKSIILIDNYIDDTVLTLLTKRKKGVQTIIYSKTITNVLKQDIEKHNLQYEPIEIKILQTSHDRFLIIDEMTIYHFGASLKDLGKKWFAFSKLELNAKDILEKL
ncbi:MAG: hypothetical protein AMXMBFR49_21210 [Chlorobiota bacterium]